MTKYNFRNYEIVMENNNINITSTLSTFIGHVQEKYEGYNQSEKTPQFILVIAQVKCTDGSGFSLGSRYPVDILNEDSIKKYEEYIQLKYDVLEFLRPGNSRLGKRQHFEHSQTAR